MSIYNRLRLDIKHEQVEIKADEQKADVHDAVHEVDLRIWMTGKPPEGSGGNGHSPRFMPPGTE